MAETAMRIEELAKLGGISTSALRYYEEAGLLGPAGRTDAVSYGVVSVPTRIA